MTNGTAMPSKLPNPNAGDCALEECSSPARARGYCRKHYERQKRWGDPNFKPRPGIDYDNKPRRGADHPLWVGDKISYGGAHDRVRSARGKASDYLCVSCGKQARYWAYNGRDPNQIYGDGTTLMFYSADPNYYDPMCSKCHADADSAPLRALRTWMHQTGITMPELLRRIGV